MRPENIGQILNKLQHVKTINRKEWQADCPCAGHATPGQHLHITDTGDKALAKCFSAHSYEEIIAALGFESLTYGGSQRIEAIYDYTDATGNVLYQVLRMSPKTFKQRRPDGNGGYAWNLKGVRPVLYRLPEVEDAIRAGRTIYIVEGEKDADNLAKIGLTATTNSSGAEKWQPELSEALGGASVAIIPDKDAAGQRHADKVAASLCGKAMAVKVVELPDIDGHNVKDASDWLAAGGTRDELERLTSGAKAYHKDHDSLVCMATIEPETVSWLWWPYIPLGKLTLLEGDPGIGKSWLSLAMATAVSLGKGLPAAEVTDPANVLLASAEDGLGDTIRPRLDAMGADVSRIHAIKGALDFGNGLAVLEQYIELLRPTLVIVDPLVAYIGANVDIHRANETRAIMARLADIAERYSVAILAIRHLTKGGTLKPIYRGLGSIDLAAACRSMLMAGCDPEEPQKRGIVHIKSNLAPMGAAIGYELRADGFYWTGESDLTWQKILSAEDSDARSARDEATEFLRDELAEGPMEAADVWKDAKEAGLAEATVKRAKAALGIITRRHGETGRRGGGKFTWELPGHLEGQKDLEDQEYQIKNFDTLNQNSYEKGTVLETHDPLNTDLGYQGDLEDHGDLIEYDQLPLLGLTHGQVVDIWTAEGSPAIPLSQCETCTDLAKTLAHDVKEKDIRAITDWLSTTLAAQRDCVNTTGEHD